MAFKVMLATDADEENITYPCYCMPKIDGVHGISLENEGLFARTMKRFGNKYITSFFSQPEFANLNGELAAAEETHPDLCRLTSSATSTHKGEPALMWHIFDYVHPSVIDEDYPVRHAAASAYVDTVNASNPELGQHLKMIPYVVCNTEQERLMYEELLLDKGYEGIIIRFKGKGYKLGRSTQKQGYLLRIKRYVEEEAMVLAIEEGETNLNEATINELGYTTRSSHQENKVPNGMLGKLICQELKTGNEQIVAPGSLTHDERRHYFQHPEEIVGKVIKFKHFPRGVKVKRRFPQFVTIRPPEDII